MKTKIKTLVLLLMVTSLTFTACKKEKEDGDNNSSSDSKVTLKIDNDSEIVYTNVTASILNNKIVIGSQNSNSDLEIIVNKDISNGTYSQQEIAMSYGVNSVAVFTSITNVTSLSFVVSSHNTNDKHIKGTFTLSYDDNNTGAPHTATGSFNVYYVTY
jgi:hypothetical protein